MISRGSEWHRWEAHIHAPGTILNNQFGTTDPWGAYLTHAREHFEEDETPVEIVFGAYETQVLGSDSVRNGVFIATDRRLVFFGKKMFGFDLESFPYWA